MESGTQGRIRPSIDRPGLDASEERERRARMLLRVFDSATKIESLQGQKVETVFGNEQSRRAFIEGLTPEDYRLLLTGINGILRGDSQADWFIDGQNVKMGDLDIFPDADDKTDLLDMSLDAAKQLSAQGESMTTIAALLSTSFVGIHPFGDGNGRTSRTLRAMVEYDFTPENRNTIFALIASNEGSRLTSFSNVDGHLIQIIRKSIDPELRRFITNDYRTTFVSLFKGKEINLPFYPDVDEEVKRQFIEVGKHASGLLLGPAVFEAIAHKLKGDYEDGGDFIFDRILPDLTSEDISAILENYRAIKRKLVELFIDAMVHPDKPEYQIAQAGMFKSIKAILLEKEERGKAEILGVI